MTVSNLTKMVESSLDSVKNVPFPTEFSKDLHCRQVKTRAYYC